MNREEHLYRTRFASQYHRLFYDAWKISRFSPVTGTFWLRTLARQKNLALRRKRATAVDMEVPPVMIFSVTRSCNLKCTGCYARNNHPVPGKDGAELPLTRIRTLFSEAASLGIGVVMIAGGEPLMRPEILHAASQQRDLIFPVFTNGTLLSDNSSRLFRHNRNLIPVLSLEGDPSRTDSRRGPGTYRSVKRGMDVLKKQSVFFGLSVTLTRDNYNLVTSPEWMSARKKDGARLFFLVEYVPQGTGDEHLCLNADQKRELHSHLTRLREDLDVLIINLPGDEVKYGGCLAAGRGFIHIGSQGEFEPCPFAPYSDTNISRISLEDALRSPFLARLRNSHHLLGESTGGCTLWENRDWVNEQLSLSLQRMA